MWNLPSVQMMEVHLEEMLHPEASKRLAREASGLEQRRLRQYLCRWPCRVGRFLVALGQRLQRAGAPLAVGLEKRLNT